MHITKAFIGHISLNISLILYLTYYLPQLYHNRQRKNLIKLSVYFHYLMLLGYLSDLIYAFGMHMPWQYCLVSVVGSCYLLYQHWQLNLLKQYQSIKYINGLLILALIGLASLFFLTLPKLFYIKLEVITQFASFVYALPQIIRNYRLKSGAALSISFLCLDSLCVICDLISAWFLGWPWPNQIGSIVRLGIKFILLGQCLYYKKTPADYTKKSLFNLINKTHH